MEQIALMEILVCGFKDELGRAYKESDMIRQRLNSYENEFISARTCVGDLVSKLAFNESHQLILEEDVDRAERKATDLEIRIHQLEQDNIRLERERDIQSRKTVEVIAKSTSDESSWKRALELASTQASERAERALADCEWKMRELEKRARDSDKKVAELSISLKNNEKENEAQKAQIRVLSDEQQRSVAALSTRCVAAESREMILKQDLEENKERLESARERTAAFEEKVKKLESLKAKLTCNGKQHEISLTEARYEAECELPQQRHLPGIEQHDREMDAQGDEYKVRRENAEQEWERLEKKYACLNKLFEYIKKSNTVATEAHLADQREMAALRSEATRLTNVILHNGITPNTRTDGCVLSKRRKTSAEIFHEFVTSCSLSASKQTTCRTSNISSQSKQYGQSVDKMSTKSHTESIEKHTRPTSKKVLASKVCYARRFQKRKTSFSFGKSKMMNLPAVQVPIRIKQLEAKNV